MPFIYDPETFVDCEFVPFVKVGSLVQYGAVINTGNKRNLGIIIDVECVNVVNGDYVFYVYTEGTIIRTAMVYPVIEELK